MMNKHTRRNQGTCACTYPQRVSLVKFLEWSHFTVMSPSINLPFRTHFPNLMFTVNVHYHWRGVNSKCKQNLGMVDLNKVNIISASQIKDGLLFLFFCLVVENVLHVVAQESVTCCMARKTQMALLKIVCGSQKYFSQRLSTHAACSDVVTWWWLRVCLVLVQNPRVCKWLSVLYQHLFPPTIELTLCHWPYASV